MGNKLCPFCEYEKLTEIFYWNKWKNIIICRDKNNLGFKYRLLAIRTGPSNHKSLPTLEERKDLMVPLIAVAQAHIANGKASGYTIDEVAKSVPQHYHYQINLT